MALIIRVLNMAGRHGPSLVCWKNAPDSMRAIGATPGSLLIHKLLFHFHLLIEAKGARQWVPYQEEERVAHGTQGGSPTPVLSRNSSLGEGFRKAEVSPPPGLLDSGQTTASRRLFSLAPGQQHSLCPGWPHFAFTVAGASGQRASP